MGAIISAAPFTPTLSRWVMRSGRISEATQRGSGRSSGAAYRSPRKPFPVIGEGSDRTEERLRGGAINEWRSVFHNRQLNLVRAALTLSPIAAANPVQSPVSCTSTSGASRIQYPANISPKRCASRRCSASKMGGRIRCRIREKSSGARRGECEMLPEHQARPVPPRSYPLVAGARSRRVPARARRPAPARPRRQSAPPPGRGQKATPRKQYNLSAQCEKLEVPRKCPCKTSFY